jgi:hypothetical protein
LLFDKIKKLYGIYLRLKKKFAAKQLFIRAGIENKSQHITSACPPTYERIYAATKL